MPTVPDDYYVWKAAQSCGVPPWVMEDAPLEWLNKALTYEMAVSIAENTKVPTPTPAKGVQ